MFLQDVMYEIKEGIGKTVIKSGVKVKIYSGLIIFFIAIVSCFLLLLMTINEAGKKEMSKDIKKKKNVNVYTVGFSSWIWKEKFEIPLEPVASLLYSDLQILKNRCREIKSISLNKIIQVSSVKVMNKIYPPIQTSPPISAFIGLGGGQLLPFLAGIYPEYKEIMDLEVQKGRFINRMDMLYKRRVCVLGKNIYEQIGVKDVIGKKLVTKNPDGEFTIVGVLREKMPFFSSLPEKLQWDAVVTHIGDKQVKRSKNETTHRERKYIALGENNSIYIPFTTGCNFTKGIDGSSISIGEGIILERQGKPPSLPPGAIEQPSYIKMKIEIPKREDDELIVDEWRFKINGDIYFMHKGLKKPIEKMKKVLKKRYGEDKYFDFYDCGSLVEEIESEIKDTSKIFGITALFTLFLSSILLASMMLMLVHKRVNEIGVRRAFGARKQDIFCQFLAEGVSIYAVGIIIGIVFGLIASYFVIVRIAGWEYSIPILSIIMSSIFVFIVGILSSLYPAIRAANIPPAQAVRYE